MKSFKAFLVVFLIFPVIFSIGCAARQTIQKETTVEEPTVEKAKKSGKKYIVKKGDTLWDIAGKSSIYGDNFQWPLLFKANRDQIEDPDIIEVNQELDVKTDWSKAEVKDAIQKAKDTPPYVPHTKPRKKLPLRY